MAAKADPLAALMATAEKKYGLTVGALDEITTDTKFFTSGNVAIDAAIGGGIPMGRSIELFGPPSSGKTTLTLQSAIEMQKIIMGGGSKELEIAKDDVIFYFDYEQAMDLRYAKALGLDTKHPSFRFTQPDTLESGADFCLAAFKTGRVRLAVFDSVAAMNPSAQAEAESVGKSLPAVQAKLMKPFGVTLNSVLRNHNGTVMFINHEMEKMEMGGHRRPGMPAPTTTPGGSALKYFASVRVRFSQIRQNKGEIIDPVTNEKMEVPTSTDVRVKVMKNKVAPPFREATVRVAFGKGFDPFWTAIQILLAAKKVKYQSPKWYFHELEAEGGAPDWMPREPQGMQRAYLLGEKRVFKMAEAHPEWRKLLIEMSKKVVSDNAEALDQVAKLGVVEEDSDEEDGETSEELDALVEKKTGSKRASISR